jgi:hypothetical protein
MYRRVIYSLGIRGRRTFSDFIFQATRDHAGTPIQGVMRRVRAWETLVDSPRSCLCLSNLARYVRDGLARQSQSVARHSPPSLSLSSVAPHRPRSRSTSAYAPFLSVYGNPKALTGLSRTPVQGRKTGTRIRQHKAATTGAIPDEPFERRRLVSPCNSVLVGRG